MLHALVLNDCHVDTFNAVVPGAKFTFHQHVIIFRKSLFTFCTHPTLIRHTLNYLIISVIIIQKRVCTCASVFAGGFLGLPFFFLSSVAFSFDFDSSLLLDIWCLCGPFVFVFRGSGSWELQWILGVFVCLRFVVFWLQLQPSISYGGKVLKSSYCGRLVPWYLMQFFVGLSVDDSVFFPLTAAIMAQLLPSAVARSVTLWPFPFDPFKRIFFIFPWNNSTYDLDPTVSWLKSLGYSINARAFGPLTPYLAVGLAGVTMCTRVNNYLWNHIFCHFKASLFLFQLMFVLDKRNTLCLRDKVRRTSLGKSAAGVDLRAAQQPLTSHWMSAGLYRVTTKCSYYNKSSTGVSYTSVQFDWDPFVNKDARSSWVLVLVPWDINTSPDQCVFHNVSVSSVEWVSCRNIIIPSAQKSCWGVYWFHSVRLSICQYVRPSVRPYSIPCPLCTAYSSGWIHFIFWHLIKQLQKVCRM